MKWRIDDNPCTADLCKKAFSCPNNHEAEECEYLLDWIVSSTYNHFYKMDMKK